MFHHDHHVHHVRPKKKRKREILGDIETDIEFAGEPWLTLANLGGHSGPQRPSANLGKPRELERTSANLSGT